MNSRIANQLIRQSYFLAKSFHPRITANERKLRISQIPAESHRAEIRHAFKLRHCLLFVSKPRKCQRILKWTAGVWIERRRVRHQFFGFCAPPICSRHFEVGSCEVRIVERTW